MLQRTYSSRIKTRVYPIDPTYCRLTPVSVARDGVLVQMSEFKRHNAAELLGKFTSRDFAFDNLESLGVTGLLKHVTMHVDNVDTFVESVERINSLESKN